MLMKANGEKGEVEQVGFIEIEGEDKPMLSALKPSRE